MSPSLVHTLDFTGEPKFHLLLQAALFPGYETGLSAGNPKNQFPALLFAQLFVILWQNNMIT